MEFTTHQQSRYSRHFLLKEVGPQGQKKLLSARVLCVGAGALGSIVLPILACAGIGVIGVVDDDVVELSNLQRQTLYQTDDIGQLKVEKAYERLHALNNDISIIAYPLRLHAHNAEKLIENYDYVIDCTDNFDSRYVLNAVCVLQKIPYLYAGIHQFTGQCSVFSTLEGPCYRCLFPEPPKADEIPNCAQAGVLSSMPGIIGSIQANELFKLILGIGQPLIGKLLKIDALSLSFQTYQVSKRANCEGCSTKNKTLLDAMIPSSVSCSLSEMIEITAKEAKKKMDMSEMILLDVREDEERSHHNIGGRHIPFSQLSSRIAEIQSLEKPILIYCASGKRSLHAAMLLKENYQIECYSLKGGMKTWFEA